MLGFKAMLLQYSTYFTFPNKIFLTSYLLLFLSFLHICSVQKPKKTDEVIDGEEFIENIIAGEEPTGTPEHLEFTAPFKICKGGCNESNFVMSFPIYVGSNKGGKQYNKTYPRDVNLFDSEENPPFKKFTTRHPFTLCPENIDSSAKIIPQTMKPGCEDKVRIKNVMFKDSLEFKQDKIIFILALMNNNNVEGIFPWEKWSWSAPQEPIEYFFRRQNNEYMRLKRPQVQCDCLLNNECKLDYKFNRNTKYFQSIRGIVNSETLKQLDDQMSNNDKKIKSSRKTRDIDPGDAVVEKECCCPPRTIKVPTFISNSRFNDVLERLRGKSNDNDT